MKPETGKTRAQPLLGTFVEITLDTGAPDSLFLMAFTRMRVLERVFNFHDPESELSGLNRSAGHFAHACSAEMFSLLGICAELVEASGGLFDPSVPASLPSRSWGDVMLAQGRARLSAGTQLNLNGVAKGFIVDQACELLMREGAGSALVNAGGDLRREGKGEALVWVRDPANPGALRNFGTLQSGAVATSAGYFLPSASEPSPYVDPRNGKFLGEIPSITIAAPFCVHADALTKLAMLGGACHAALSRFGAQALILAA